jgi:hypothetical protein
VGESVPILALVSAVAIWGPPDAAEAAVFAGRVGVWVGPIAGGLTVLMVTAWAGTKSSAPVLQGALIGLMLAVLDTAILVATGASFAWVFVASNGGKVAAGAVGGWVAARIGVSRVSGVGGKGPG